MAQLRYPVGMQTFSNIIEEGYTYVDKTAYIKPLLSQGKYIFLSRPRRFGKSLLLSTLAAYFEGRRELFKGLAADTMDLNWTSSPVLSFDFNSANYKLENGLEMLIRWYLQNYEREYGIASQDTPIFQRLKNLIRNVYEQTNRKVVILIDEYNKPLTEVEKIQSIFEKNQTYLQNFFGVLQAMEEYIQFAFITGVARFKVNIFNDLLKLDDISLKEEFSDICGWTENELLEYFDSGIRFLAEKREESFDLTIKTMRNYYKGYQFASHGSSLYNPWDVLGVLDSKRMDPHWYITGSPTLFAERIKNLGIYPPNLNSQICAREDLIAVTFGDPTPIPLMFQTGYLTIASYKENLNLYELRFPNREVEMGFYQQLLQIYVPEVNHFDTPFYFLNFKIDLFEGRVEDFMRRLQALFKSLPSGDHRESSYRAITYLLAVLCGTKESAESHGYKDISDVEVISGNFIYIFEFKYNKSVKEAIDQIHSRDYATKYAMDSRSIYLIGANFNENKENRGLHYEIKQLK